jgi:hypothetical protein
MPYLVMRITQHCWIMGAKLSGEKFHVPTGKEAGATGNRRYSGHRPIQRP